MPKIDWQDDDQPRWERLHHVRRAYHPRLLGRPPAFTVPIVTARRSPDQDQPARRPLHLIWGEPDRSNRSAPSP
jgi:hypothetical protein